MADLAPRRRRRSPPQQLKAHLAGRRFTSVHALGEWIRDLPPDSLSEFLADMEISARQASDDSDIGSFISTLADWQTSAEAARNGW